MDVAAQPPWSSLRDLLLGLTRGGFDGRMFVWLVDYLVDLVGTNNSLGIWHTHIILMYHDLSLFIYPDVSWFINIYHCMDVGWCWELETAPGMGNQWSGYVVWHTPVSKNRGHQGCQQANLTLPPWHRFVPKPNFAKIQRFEASLSIVVLGIAFVSQKISPERIRTVVLSSCSSNEVTDENSPGIWGYLIWIPGAKSAIWCRDRGFALRFSCCLHKLWEICLPWSTRCERDFEPWLNGWFVFHVLASAFYDLHEENCIQSPCHVIWA